MSEEIDWSTRAHGHRSFVTTVAGCAVMFVAGVAAGLRGSTLPVFSAAPETVQQSFMAWCTGESQVDNAAGERYFELFTDHYAWVDAGSGLVLTALTIAGLAFVLRVRMAPNNKWLRTPERRETFVLLGTGALLWLYGALIRSLWVDLARDQFPWCADSIAIPMFGLTVVAVVTVPALVLAGWAATRLFGTLPAPLSAWDQASPRRSWIVTIVFGAAMLAAAAALVDSARTSLASATPTFVLAIYLLASTRAALLSPRAHVDAESLPPRDAVTD